MSVAHRVSVYFDGPTAPDVVSVYLFGSRAEDRAHRESDLDLGFLFDRNVHRTRRDRFDAALRIAANLRADLGIDAVDVVVLNDAPPLLGRRVVTEGQRLICRDPEGDHAYLRDVQLRAADLLPFLERMRRIKLEALAPR
ncbi:MAG: nucleotidyltransferase domain-containing protein [Thermoanaerobaculales bacterium]|jgi:hypothetical protein|nr:nucleotidyltransferase domain-containing protein [Thermoanaerobaculales bacterium]